MPLMTSLRAKVLVKLEVMCVSSGMKLLVTPKYLAQRQPGVARRQGWRFRQRMAELEDADRACQPCRLFLHRRCRRRRLLDQRCVFLRGLVHLDNGLADLGNAGA